MLYHDLDIYHIISKEVNLLVYGAHDRDHAHDYYDVLQHVFHPFEQQPLNDYVLKQVRIFLMPLLIRLQLFIHYFLNRSIALLIHDHFTNLFHFNFLNFIHLHRYLVIILFARLLNFLRLIFYVLSFLLIWLQSNIYHIIQ